MAMELQESEWSRPVLTVEDVEHLAARLYGSPPAGGGILHPTAVWQTRESADSEPLTTLNINEQTPKSQVDSFALNLARARADAVITTGRILRSEPDVTHAFGESTGLKAALTRWRRQRLGKADPLISLVLTSGRDLDLKHPLFVSGDSVPLIFTSPAGRERLLPRAPRSLEIASAEEPSIHRAIQFLRQQREVRTISIETGPKTSCELYRSSGQHPDERVDELLLSTFQAPTIPESVCGPPFITRNHIRENFQQPVSSRQIRTPEGLWIFERFLR